MELRVLDRLGLAEPLVALLGEETYHEAQAAFTRFMQIEVQGDWAVGTGCVQHACDMLGA